MTEKRFEMVITGSDGSFHYLDNVTDERIISTLELENKLNELSEENEQLKEQLSEQGTQIDFLQAENKHLGEVLRENKHLRCTIESNSQDDYIDYLKNENEQLKQEIDSLQRKLTVYRKIKRLVKEND